MRAAALVSILALGGCVRDPVEAFCPPIGAGDLVITEIRGQQTEDDSLGPWIELYNASDAAIDLEGIKVRFSSTVDGNTKVAPVVRRGLPVAAGSYVVLGLFDDGHAPAHVDYGLNADFHETWPDRAGVDVETCGVLVDHIQYDQLPGKGTYSLGGPPDADTNDTDDDLRPPANWCDDITPVSSTFPGTPRAPNKACP